MYSRVREALDAPLVDHHCHGVRRDELDRAGFELLLTESASPAPPGTTHFDTPAGLAVRRWCAPVLGLDPHAAPVAYVDRRRQLGPAEVNRRFLRAARIGTFLVDTGLDEDAGLTAAEMGLLAGAAEGEIVRLERVERDVVSSGGDVRGYLYRLEAELRRRTEGAAGLKSIIAYRAGLGFDPSRPSDVEVTAAAARRLARGGRLTDPVLLRHLLWLGVDVARERGLPIQFHTGFGDSDLDLHRADPSLLTGFIRRAEAVPLVLLHCYPYHRQAAYLAAIFPQVYVDVGLSLTHTAAGSGAVLAEVLELAPLHKVLFSSDCYGLAEFCLLGAHYFREALGRALAVRLDAGEWSTADAARAAEMIGSGNARRVYRL